MRKTFVIAEAGVNHNGNINLAKKLIDVAADAGADAVKFQTFKAVNLVSKQALKADYQKQTTDSNESQFEMIKKLELDADTHKQLIAYCKKKDIMFLSTPFDHESIELLDKLGLKIFKIPSGEITNRPYLEHIGRLGKQVVLSTGMATLVEVGDALGILTAKGTKKENITVLHANTEYPTPMQDVNLLAMQTIQKEFGVKIGYSDHTLGIEIPIAAVVMGASVIEKHFTLDKTMDGPDHKASLEPQELKAMVKAIRNIEKAMGNGVKKPSPSEKKNIAVARKSIHLASSVKANTKLLNKMLIMKRPGNGISPMDIDKIAGKKVNKDLKADHKLRMEDLI